MEKNNEILLQEQIHAFLVGEASDAEQKRLLEEAASDPEIAEELAFSKGLLNTLRYPDATTAVLVLRKVIAEEGFPPSSPPFLIWKKIGVWLGGAALITLLVVSSYYFFINQQGKQPPIYAEWAQAKLRPLENVFFVSPDSLPILQQAMNAYDEKRYGEAARLLEKHLMQHNDNAARLYLGVCYLLNGRTDLAIPVLSIAAQSQEPPIQEAALWYLGLSYLKDGQLPLAKYTLEAIPPESVYGHDVIELLEKL